MRRHLEIAGALLGALLLAPCFAPFHAEAQVAPMQVPAKGRLLVATEEIRDPNFARTVLLLLHHDDNGTIGVAVNRPTWLGLEDVQPDQGAVAGYDGRVFRGGPLAPTQVIFLVRNPPQGAFDAPPILGRVYASGNLELLPTLAPSVGGDGIRLYAGHAEWSAGQLDREIAAGQWTVVDGSTERVFEANPRDMWQVLSSGGPELLVQNLD